MIENLKSMIWQPLINCILLRSTVETANPIKILKSSEEDLRSPIKLSESSEEESDSSAKLSESSKEEPGGFVELSESPEEKSRDSLKDLLKSKLLLTLPESESMQDIFKLLLKTIENAEKDKKKHILKKTINNLYKKTKNLLGNLYYYPFLEQPIPENYQRHALGTLLLEIIEGKKFQERNHVKRVEECYTGLLSILKDLSDIYNEKYRCFQDESIITPEVKEKILKLYIYFEEQLKLHNQIILGHLRPIFNEMDKSNVHYSNLDKLYQTIAEGLGKYPEDQRHIVRSEPLMITPMKSNHTPTRTPKTHSTPNTKKSIQAYKEAIEDKEATAKRKLDF